MGGFCLLVELHREGSAAAGLFLTSCVIIQKAKGISIQLSTVLSKHEKYKCHSRNPTKIMGRNPPCKNFSSVVCSQGLPEGPGGGREGPAGRLILRPPARRKDHFNLFISYLHIYVKIIVIETKIHL